MWREKLGKFRFLEATIQGLVQQGVSIEQIEVDVYRYTRADLIGLIIKQSEILDSRRRSKEEKQAEEIATIVRNATEQEVAKGKQPKIAE